MKKNYKVFIVEDHPLICKAYQKTLDFVSEKTGVVFKEIVVCNTLENAYQKISDCHENNIEIDIIFLDVQLTPAPKHEIYSGLDLGEEIKKKMPNTSIILLTAFEYLENDSKVHEKLNPKALLIKNDINLDTLINSIISIIKERNCEIAF
ncbi:response regulator [Aureivirga marina]|uniref:response regulator n=1 Tax=Aureivirga marina TaxID=1182451 RepID=UPI0018CAD135|nr:response regulator [Aureivirga marina]